MVDILLQGSCHTASFISVLSSVLEKAFCVGLNLSNQYEHTAHCDYLITQLDNPQTIRSEQALWLIDRPASCIPPFSLSGNIVAVLCSHDQNAIQLAARCNVPAITCGLNPWDTVTLSSITSDTAQICLQRSVTSLCGTSIEPTEIPVRLSGSLSQEHLLMLAASFLLLDQAALLQNSIL